MSTKRKQALGRGLGALLGTNRRPDNLPHAYDPPTNAIAAKPNAGQAPAATITPPVAPTPVGDLIQAIPLGSIKPNPRQPRRHFDQERLNELANSIQEHGILQPVILTPGDTDGSYYLIAGERRWRASQLAGKATIPARVLTATDRERLEVAIVENVQRDDLNPVEEARAYQDMISAFTYSQDQVAKRVGKSRVSVTNALRLLKLTEGCLADLEAGRLSAGHARAILSLPHPGQQEMLRKEIVEKGLSVREAEERSRHLLAGNPPSVGKGKPSAAKSAAKRRNDLDVQALEERLTLRLGCRTSCRSKANGSGKIEIAYPSLDDLDRILELLGVRMDD